MRPILEDTMDLLDDGSMHDTGVEPDVIPSAFRPSYIHFTATMGHISRSPDLNSWSFAPVP